MTTITTLPTPPSRSDPINFSPRSDAFLGALPTFGTELDTVASEVNTNASNAASSAAIATAQAQAAIAAANAVLWVSGTNYNAGASVYSPITLASYRTATAGVSSTDPSIDTSRWTRINSSSFPDFILINQGVI